MAAVAARCFTTAAILCLAVFLWLAGAHQRLEPRPSMT